MKTMRTRGVLCALGLLAAACGNGGNETPGSGGAPSSSGGKGGASGAGGAGGAGGDVPSSVVWVGAHPDDELYAAPWLGYLCIERGASCTFVVMTRGEAGKCKLAAGCAPDLATVRDGELAQSAAMYGAKLLHWDLGDGTSGDVATVADNWAAAAGGPDKLLADLTAIFAKAERIVTFDPRHGDSCHADHRAAGAVALAVAEQMGAAAPPVTLVASKLVTSPAVADDPAIWSFDASAPSSKLGKDYWSVLISVLKVHQSQFTTAEVATLEAVPPASRKTYLLEASDAVKDDPRYAGVCAP
jgi:LmbE family N-acetylglucosaminyl deacetylase